MTYVFSHKYLHLISTNPRLAPRMSCDNPSTKLGVAEIEDGFPHSEIRGSKVVRTSPRLIAAYHVLHRLSAPRHPPNTLKTLDHSHYRRPPLGSGLQDLHLAMSSIERPFASNISENVAVTQHSQTGSSTAKQITFSGDRIYFLFTMTNSTHNCSKAVGETNNQGTM